MNRVFIQKLLSLGENQHLEFKSSVKQIDALGRIICGFLNTAGGYLICGISLDGEINGIEVSAGMIASLEKKIHAGLFPKTLVSVHVQTIDDKSVVVIEVPAGKDVPYAYRDVIYIRSGESTLKADVQTIRDIVMRHQIEPERWERRFSLASLDSDVDVEQVRAIVLAAQKVRRAFFRDSNDLLKVLEDLSVAKYGRLTNAGDVLLGLNPVARLPQIRVRAVCYLHDKVSNTYIDMKSFEGALIPTLEHCFEFIVRNTATQANFSDKEIARKDSYLYPENAVREALVNAFAHRDYASSAGGITISIYPGRLEIRNSGTLPEGVTPDQLTIGQLSILRNPDIAHVLYLSGLMEKLGRGSVLILTECKEHGLRKPVWTSVQGEGVTLTLYAPKASLQHKGGKLQFGKTRNVVGPPVDAQNFFGRYRELAEIGSVLDHGDNILLLGPRRVGKTSLANQLVSEKTKQHWSAVRLSADACLHEVDFINLLLMRLADLENDKSGKEKITQLKQALNALPRDFPFTDGIHLVISSFQRTIALAMDRIFAELEARQAHILICVDEIAIFLSGLQNQQNGMVRIEHLLHWLRAIRFSYPKYIHWMFIDDNRLDTFLSKFKTSGGMNDLRHFVLAPFSSEEADDFLAVLALSHHLKITSQVRKAIIERIELLLPFNLQLIFSKLREIGQVKIDESDVNAAFTALNQPGSPKLISSY